MERSYLKIKRECFQGNYKLKKRTFKKEQDGNGNS